MKFIIPTLTILITAAVSLPESSGWQLRSAEDVNNEKLPIIDLVVTDPRFPGRTFNGSIEEVYKQMAALKPELFEKRSPPEVSVSKRQEAIDCGWGEHIGSWRQCIDGMTYLMNGIPDANCGVAAAPACVRVSCSYGCGMYLCSKVGHHIDFRCGDIPPIINKVASECQDTIGRVRGKIDYNDYWVGLGWDKENC